MTLTRVETTTPGGRSGRFAKGLVMSCHPLPTLAVTAISAGLATLVGLSVGRAAVLIAAVFAGQLSIGWSNDAIDAVRDRASDRADKPVARGVVSPRAVAVAARVALGGSIVLSLLLGVLPGLACLTVVVCGWIYNLGVKATAFSFVPYAVAFGMLPAVATLALPESTWPAAWAMIAGALFGVSAHLANALPDLDDDVDTGVRGLPHRVGARAAAVACPALLGAASLAILMGSAGGSGSTAASGLWRWVVTPGLVVLVGVGVLIGGRQPRSRALFVIVIVAALMAVVLFAAAGRSLT